MQGANMEEIFKMAQTVATNIAGNQSETLDPQNIDMSKVISQVTQSVSQMITPEMIEKMSGSSINSINNNIPDFKSKINFDEETTHKSKKKSTEKLEKKSGNVSSSLIEELEESDNECLPIAPRTKDLHFTLNVTLEELYSGKIKKLAVRRKRMVEEGSKKSIVDEKKKITVNIEPGMFDEQVITFNKQADEKEGYETGDIIITLCSAEHEKFEREGDNLLMELAISIYEAFDCNMTITHLNGKEFNILSSPINIFGEEIECYRKLKGYGMPVLGKEDTYGDLIIKFKPIIPQSLTDEQLFNLKGLFPKINEIKELPKELQHELEFVTESDFEYSDSEDESDSESDSDEDSDDNSEDDSGSEPETDSD